MQKKFSFRLFTHSIVTIPCDNCGNWDKKAKKNSGGAHWIPPGQGQKRKKNLESLPPGLPPRAVENHSSLSDLVSSFCLLPLPSSAPLLCSTDQHFK